MPMTLAELTEAMHEFVQAKGWYEPESPKPQSLRSLAISLSLEAAEVLEHFQWQDKAPGDMDDRRGQHSVRNWPTLRCISCSLPAWAGSTWSRPSSTN